MLVVAAQEHALDEAPGPANKYTQTLRGLFPMTKIKGRANFKLTGFLFAKGVLNEGSMLWDRAAVRLTRICGGSPCLYETIAFVFIYIYIYIRRVSTFVQ